MRWKNVHNQYQLIHNSENRMNMYAVGDIIKIVELYRDPETLYYKPFKSSTGLLIEEIDDGLLQILAGGQKEVHDINPSPYIRFKVEVISEGNENEKG